MKGVDGNYSPPAFIIDNRGNYIYGQTFSEMDEYPPFCPGQYDIIYNGYPVEDYPGKEGISSDEFQFRLRLPGRLLFCLRQLPGKHR